MLLAASVSVSSEGGDFRDHVGVSFAERSAKRLLDIEPVAAPCDGRAGFGQIANADKQAGAGA